MDLISYRDLSQLRLRDFLGRDAQIDVEESGMIGLVGLGGWERFGETYFAWRQGEPYQTAGVDLDLKPESLLSTEDAMCILERLGLPVARGMAASELMSIFGAPEKSTSGRPGTRLLYFICGETEPFRVGCVVEDGLGLTSLYFARKDYLDEDDAI